MFFQKLFYEEKDVFLQSLHTFVILMYLAVLFILSLLFNHPLYLISIFVISAIAVIASDCLEKWELYLKFGLWMAVLIILINPLLFHGGKTIIWQFSVPLVGSFKFCLEAVCYGAAMGVRLLSVLTIFSLYNALVHPDKNLSLFSRVAHKSALVVSLATRMLPGIVRDLVNAQEVQQLRGVNYNTGSLKERIKKYSYLLDIVLLSSLEGALQTAEAMHARAFGSGPRTCYQRELVRPRDHICIVATIIALVVSIYVKVKGFSNYTFYPQLDNLVNSFFSLIYLGVIIVALLVPVVLSWGWKYCPCLRSKI